MNVPDFQGDDDAYLCIREDQTVSIQPSYLTGRSYPVMDSRVSGNILRTYLVGPPSCSVAAIDGLVCGSLKPCS